MGGRIAGRAPAHAGARGDRHRASADARGVRPGRARARVREPRARLLRPRARRRADPAQGAQRGRPRHRLLGHARERRSSSRSSAFALAGPLAVALRRRRTPSRCSRCSRSASWSYALGAPAAVADAARHGLPPRGDPPDDRRPGRRRRGRGGGGDRRRRLGDHRPVRGRRAGHDDRGLAALAVEAALRLLARTACATSAASASSCSATGCSTTSRPTATASSSAASSAPRRWAPTRSRSTRSSSRPARSAARSSA